MTQQFTPNEYAPINSRALLGIYLGGIFCWPETRFSGQPDLIGPAPKVCCCCLILSNLYGVLDNQVSSISHRATKMSFVADCSEEGLAVIR